MVSPGALWECTSGRVFAARAEASDALALGVDILEVTILWYSEAMIRTLMSSV